MRRDNAACARGAYGTVYSKPFESVMLFGGAKPGSRPHHWQSTTVPGVVSAASGVPPKAPTAKAFMSSAKTPEQSFVGAGLPPELTAGVRRICDLTHSVPPW